MKLFNNVRTGTYSPISARNIPVQKKRQTPVINIMYLNDSIKVANIEVPMFTIDIPTENDVVLDKQVEQVEKLTLQNALKELPESTVQPSVSKRKKRVKAGKLVQ